MPDAPEIPEVPARRSADPLAIKLNGWYRAAAIILGLAGLGSGGVAVFVTHLEAGPVALLAVGFLLLIIGMGGHMPSRLKVGDNEAAWEVEREAVEVFVERVSEEASVERRPEVIEALGELAEGAPRLAAVGMSGIAYEQLVRHTIMEAFKDDRIEDLDREPIRFITQSKPDMGFDGIVVGPNGSDDCNRGHVHHQIGFKSLYRAHASTDFPL